MRVKIFKALLWFLAGFALPVAVVRFVHGLGAVTNLGDTTPWGFWIGFDVLGGVALAAGGFVIAATVYIFHLKSFHGILRPAVLTAFLGYILVAVALLFDLGLPWNIWRPMVHWQHHSALFEVAWCVMLYLTVLGLEFFPVILEKLPFPRLLKIVKNLTLPLVILGIMLSTLHQSSLGTLFLIMPFRLNPLWYSAYLPLLFFISAIALGLSMVMVESMTTAWLYRREIEWPLLTKLSRAAGYVLVLYLTIRLGDLARHGVFSLRTAWNWESGWFVFEILLAAVVPAFLFLAPSTAGKKPAMAAGSIMVVVGMVLNRINVGGIATITATGTRYVPSWMEFAISIGLVSAAGLVFLYFVEHFAVYEKNSEREPESPQLLKPLFTDPLSDVRLGEPWAGAWHRYSLVVIIAVSVGVFLLPPQAIHGAKPIPQITTNSRLVHATYTPVDSKRIHRITLAESDSLESEAVKNPPVDVFMIDGNRDGRFVLFNHQKHTTMLQPQEKACRLCHHLNKPLNWATPCYQCHRDMYESTDTFNHPIHVEKLGGNGACDRCHQNKDQPRSGKNCRPCLDCHRRMIAPGSLVTLEHREDVRLAPGYVKAMHGLCVKCHQAEEKKDPTWQAELSLCRRCHQTVDRTSLAAWLPHL
jgi:Ni/Fe-hydrogenase subunit HybB-like protein